MNKEGNFSYYLRCKMLKHAMNQAQVGKILHLSQPDISYKIRNEAFTVNEMRTLFDFFAASDEEILQAIRW